MGKKSAENRAESPCRIIKTFKRALMIIAFSSFLAAIGPFSQIVSLVVQDHYWTHQNMKITLEDSQNRVEVYVKDKPIQKLLDEERLKLLENEEALSILESDVSFRFNNKNEALQTPRTLFTLFMTIATTCFLIACSLWMIEKKIKTGR